MQGDDLACRFHLQNTKDIPPNCGCQAKSALYEGLSQTTKRHICKPLFLTRFLRLYYHISAGPKRYCIKVFIAALSVFNFVYSTVAVLLHSPGRVYRIAVLLHSPAKDDNCGIIA